MDKVSAEEDGSSENPESEVRMQDTKAERKVKASVRKTKSLGDTNFDKINRFSDSKNTSVRVVWRTTSTAELENLGKVLGFARPSQRTRSPSPRPRQPAKIDQVFSEYYDPLAFQKRGPNDTDTLVSRVNPTDMKPNQHDLKTASSPELRDKIKKDALKFKGIPMPSVKSLKDIFEKVGENVDHRKYTPRKSYTFAGHEFSSVSRMQQPKYGRKASVLSSATSEENLATQISQTEEKLEGDKRTKPDKEETQDSSTSDSGAKVATLTVNLDDSPHKTKTAENKIEGSEQNEPQTSTAKGETDSDGRLVVVGHNTDITKESKESPLQHDRNDDEIFKLSGTVQNLKKKWENLMTLNSATAIFPKKVPKNNSIKETLKSTKTKHFISPIKSENIDLGEDLKITQYSVATEADIAKIKASNSNKEEAIAEFTQISNVMQHTETNPKEVENEERHVKIQKKEDFVIQRNTPHYSVKDITLLYESKKAQEINKQASALDSFSFSSHYSVKTLGVLDYIDENAFKDLKRNFSLDADKETPHDKTAILKSSGKENQSTNTDTEALAEINESKELHLEQQIQQNISKEVDANEAILKNTNDAVKQMDIPITAEETEQESTNVEHESAEKGETQTKTETNPVKIELNNSEIYANKYAINNTATDGAAKEDSSDTNAPQPSKIELLIREFVKSEGISNYLEVPKDESFTPTATNILESESPPNMSHLMQVNDTFRYPDLHEHVTGKNSEEALTKPQPAEEPPEKAQETPKEFTTQPTKESLLSEKPKEAKRPATDVHKPTEKYTRGLKLSHSMRSSSRELKEDELKFFRELPTNNNVFHSTNSRSVEGRERSSTIDLSSPNSKTIAEDRPASELRSSFRKYRKLHTDELKFFGAKQISPRSASEVSLHKSTLTKVMRSRSIDAGGGRKE